MDPAVDFPAAFRTQRELINDRDMPGLPPVPMAPGGSVQARVILTGLVGSTARMHHSRVSVGWDRKAFWSSRMRETEGATIF